MSVRKIRLMFLLFTDFWFKWLKCLWLYLWHTENTNFNHSLMFPSPNNDNFTSNLSFYRKTSFVSSSSTNCFAWVSTQVMELHRESWPNRQTADFTLKLVHLEMLPGLWKQVFCWSKEIIFLPLLQTKWI